MAERLFSSLGVARLAVCLVALVFFAPASAGAAEKKGKPIEFLGLRQDAGFDTPLRFGSEERELVVAELAAAGLAIVTTRRDEQLAHAPDLALGAAITELVCNAFQGNVNCKLGVEWTLFDTSVERPTYAVLTRAIVYDVIGKQKRDVMSTLLRAAVASLLKRDGFWSAARPESEAPPSFAPATFKRCTSPSAELPRQAEEATKAAVFIRTHYGTGSGFFLNSEGLVLTAAHVVDTPGLSVQTASGESLDASLIRIHKTLDVALIRVEGGKVPRCFDVAAAPSPLGTEVYAIGSPMSSQLSFSLSRGIVSGVRERNGYALLQTDTAVNPGNSGGPLLGSDGKAAGVVVAKISATGVEGIGFAVPIAAALQALGLKPDARSSPELEVPLPPPHAPKIFKDTEDPRLNTEAPAPLAPTPAPPSKSERAPAVSDSESGRSGPLPTAVAVMRYGGLVLGLAGVAGVTGTWFAYDEGKTTQQEYDTLVLWNDISWGAMLLGGGAFGASFLIGGTTDAASSTVPRRAARQRVMVSFAGRF